MTERLSVGVLGAGSIGCYVGGKLLAAGAADVLFVGRPAIGEELARHGLSVQDFDLPAVRIPPEQLLFTTELTALARCHAVLVCVKSAATAAVAAELASVLDADTVLVSLQNGVRNPEVLLRHLAPREVLPAIVGFNVVSRGEGRFHRAMSGPLVLERSITRRGEAILEVLRQTKLELETPTDIAPDQWTKLLVNLNNAVSALSGAPTRELLLSPRYRRIIAAIVAEALNVLRVAGVHPAKLRGVPIQLMPFILRLPTPLVRVVTRAQMRIDPEARSSMWEDLSRGKATEVDFLNGEIVRLAEQVGAPAPINRRVVELVRRAEERGDGPPNLPAETLWEELVRPR